MQEATVLRRPAAAKDAIEYQIGYDKEFRMAWRTVRSLDGEVWRPVGSASVSINIIIIITTTSTVSNNISSSNRSSNTNLMIVMISSFEFYLCSFLSHIKFRFQVMLLRNFVE